MEGLFITFEGPDGSGKTTQIDMLREYFEATGYNVLLTREPGGTRISEKIRNIILDPNNKEMSPVCEALLYAASRAQHVHEVIEPALMRGRVVICDRFVDSSIVYQGYARGLGEKTIEGINDFAIQGRRPDATFLLNISAEEGIERKGREGKLDRLEQEDILFHKKVCEGYNRLKGRHDGIINIDATLQKNEIHDIIVETIKKIIKKSKENK